MNAPATVSYYCVAVVTLLEDVNKKRKQAWAWETSYLIRETSHAKAKAKALRVARHETPKGILPVSFKGLAVRPRLLGVRRSVECRDTWDLVQTGTIDALDLGYMTLRFASKEDALGYAVGKSIRVTIAD